DPCPRRNSGASDNSATDRTGPSRHTIASHKSISASGHAVRHRYSSPRNHASRPAPAPSHGMLHTTPTAQVFKILWKEPEDHRAVAAPRHGDTPEQPPHNRQHERRTLNHKFMIVCHFRCQGTGNDT